MERPREIEENYVDEIILLDDVINPFVCQQVMSSNIIHPSPRFISFHNSNKHHMLDYNSNLNLHTEKHHDSLSPQIIKFSSDDDFINNPNPFPDDHVLNGMTRKWAPTTTRTRTRTRSQAQDHLMAERKRRQNLTQLFISLSKLVPGLRKLDKASLLEDAIKYLKSLQERVSDLEREEMEKSSRNHLDNSSLYEESHTMNFNNIGSTSKSRAPEISVRIAERHVLVKIYCKKQMEIMSRIPCEMEKMNLNVIDIRMMPFGGEALDVTILAQMRSDFGGTVKEDIVNHLQAAVFLNLS